MLANHTYLSLPPSLRPFWGWDNDETIDALSEIAPIWADATDLNDGDFRDRYLIKGIDLRSVHQLRKAVSATMHGQTYADMVDASRDLAEAVKQLGPDDWPAVLATAREQAKLRKEPELAREKQDDWVRLPPGERIDALGSLLECVANAKPADAPHLRKEIQHTYYDVGDRFGGDMLNAALSDALEPGVTRQDREYILQENEPYTRADPADIGAMRMMLITGALLPTAPKIEEEEVAGSRTFTEGMNGSPNRGMIFVDENLGEPGSAEMKAAHDFEAGTEGAHSDIATRSRRVPALLYDNPNPDGARYVKFDGFNMLQDETIELVDSKARIVPYSNEDGPVITKSVADGLKRKSAALAQNPNFRGVLELPTQAAADEAVQVLKELRIRNIVVRVRQP